MISFFPPSYSGVLEEEELMAMEGRCDIIEGKIKDYLTKIDTSTVVYVSIYLSIYLYI